MCGGGEGGGGWRSGVNESVNNIQSCRDLISIQTQTLASLEASSRIGPFLTLMFFLAPSRDGSTRLKYC